MGIGGNGTSFQKTDFESPKTEKTPKTPLREGIIDQIAITDVPENHENLPSALKNDFLVISVSENHENPENLPSPQSTADHPTRQLSAGPPPAPKPALQRPPSFWAPERDQPAWFCACCKGECWWTPLSPDRGMPAQAC